MVASSSSIPKGIVFGEGAKVDVGGLIATTTDISNENFNAGRLIFDRPGDPDASVVNEGSITAADAGIAAFVAPHVRNSGAITARLGTVALAAGTKVTLDLYGDSLVNFAVDAEVLQVAKDSNGDPVAALVEIDGDIRVEGGSIQLSASAARSLIDNAILSKGSLIARSVSQRGGTIVINGGDGDGGTICTGGDRHGGDDPAMNFLDGTIANALTTRGRPGRGRSPQDGGLAGIGDGGEVVVWSDGVTSFDGAISVRGGALGGDGGLAETSGHALRVGSFAHVNALAPNGRAGDWLLDPKNLTVVASGGTLAGPSVGFGTPDSSSDQSIDASAINAAAANVGLYANNVITINSPIAMTNAGVGLSLIAGRSIIEHADITTSGGYLEARINDNEFGMSAADRDPGQAVFSQDDGVSVTTNGGSITIVSTFFGGGGPAYVGDFTISTPNSEASLAAGYIIVDNRWGSILRTANGGDYLAGATGAGSGNGGFATLAAAGGVTFNRIRTNAPSGDSGNLAGAVTVVAFGAGGVTGLDRIEARGQSGSGPLIDISSGGPLSAPAINASGAVAS